MKSINGPTRRLFFKLKMKVLVIGLLLFVATAFATENTHEELVPLQEEYLVDIENVDGEGDIFEYIFPKFDEENGKRYWELNI